MLIKIFVQLTAGDGMVIIHNICGLLMKWSRETNSLRDNWVNVEEVYYLYLFLSVSIKV